MRIMTPQFFKRDMYLVKQGTSHEYDDDGNPIDNYQDPIAFLGRDGVNYQPLTAETDIQRYGTSSQEIIKAVIMNTDKAYDYFDEDSVGDLVYFFGASPYKRPSWDTSNLEKEPRNGYWANYTVDAVMPMLTHVNVFFKKHKRSGAM